MIWRRIGTLWLMLWMLAIPMVSPVRADDAEVRQVQESLRARGYNPGPSDGILGKKTRRAIRNFQRDMRLPRTGTLDEMTRTALQRSRGSIASDGSTPPTRTAPPSQVSESNTPVLAMAVAPLVYKPPQRGAPGNRVAAAVRGKEGKVPLLYALAPDDHVGLTVQEQPSLYWYLSEPTTEKVVLTIVDEQVVQPLFEGDLRPPTRNGVQQIRLADYGVKLPRDTRYKWYVSIVPDPDHRSKDIVVGGGIQRVDLTESLRAKLAQARSDQIPALYADAGLWYDTLQAIADSLTAAPGNANLRAQRAALLEQIGLQTIAAPERE